VLGALARFLQQTAEIQCLVQSLQQAAVGEPVGVALRHLAVLAAAWEDFLARAEQVRQGKEIMAEALLVVIQVLAVVVVRGLLVLDTLAAQAVQAAQDFAQP
jgi:hypothetical protein